MSAAAVGAHSSSGGGHLSLMSCVRESSPPQDLDSPVYDVEKTVGTKRKFWDVRKWFKRKNKHVEDTSTCHNDGLLEPKDTLRSRSTSELSIAEDQIRRRSGSTPMHPGLSVSHDSVFHSPHSGSELDLDAAQSSSSLSVHHHPLQPDVRLQSELTKKLQQRRHRGDTSEDDEGLPRSPCNSPTTTDGILEKTANKDNPTKSHSTCSDGSLLSMDSSEMDEDSFGQHSRHSSKLSLHDKRAPESSELSFLGPEDEDSSTPLAPLNHSAAHHKVAVRPRRTHKVPKRSRVGTSASQKPVPALPTTPEVNEDSSIRSLTPDASIKGPGAIDANKLNRSCSNAGTKSQDIFATLEEDDEKEEKKSDSFFGWLLPRKSGRKKKTKEMDKDCLKSTYNSSSGTLGSSHSVYSNTSTYLSTVEYSKPVAIDANLSIRPNALLRSGPASRQRVNPIDLPASPDFNARTAEPSMAPRFSPEQVSPFQAELRHKLGTSPNRMSGQPNSYMNLLGLESTRFTQHSDLFATPPVDYNTPPESPKSPWSERNLISTKITKYHEGVETIESIKSRARLPGLSALQQKVLSLNEDDLLDGGCKSLTDYLDNRKSTKPVTKSHSFKSANQLQRETTAQSYVLSMNKEMTVTDKKEISKAASLDSVKNLDDRLVETINETKVEAARIEVEKQLTIKECDSIIISGPSHKAVVSIASDIVTTNTSKQLYQESDQKSVTKIQLRIDSSQSSIVKRKQDATNTSKPDNDSKLDMTRRFSKDNIEVIDKDTATESGSPVKNSIAMSFMPLTTSDKANKFVSEPPLSQKKSIVNITLNSSENINLSKLFLENKSNKPESPVKTETKSHIPILQRCPPSNMIDSSIILRDDKKSMTSHDKKLMHIEKSSSLGEIKSHQLKEALITQEKISTYTSISESVVLQSANKDVRSNSNVLKPMFFAEKPVDVLKENENETPISPSRSKPALLPKSPAAELASKKVHEVQIGEKTVDNLPTNVENVVMRRKSVAKQGNEDEPELMKVFARRSLKLKDSDTETLSQQVLTMVEAESESMKRDSSDKENQSDASPQEERRKSINKEPIKNKEPPKKEPLLESADLVALRKPNIPNNKFSNQYQRTVSLNTPRVENKIVKQMSLVDRPKTDSWIHTKNESDDSMDSQPEIITSCLLSPEPDVIINSKPQNFNQRKAEWEKRAQEALKKNIP